MRAVWAAGLLLRRLRDERGIILLTAGLVAATSFLFAAAPRLFNRVSDDALRFAAVSAPPTQRNVALAVTTRIEPGDDGAVGAVALRGDRLASAFPPSVTDLISERALRLTTVSFLVADPPSYETHLSLRYQDGMADLTRLVEGRWPVDRGMPLEAREFFFGEDGEEPPPLPEPAVFEIAISAATAAELGVEVGDRYDVALDPSDFADPRPGLPDQPDGDRGRRPVRAARPGRGGLGRRHRAPRGCLRRVGREPDRVHERVHRARGVREPLAERAAVPLRVALQGGPGSARCQQGRPAPG